MPAPKPTPQGSRAGEFSSSELFTVIQSALWTLAAAALAAAITAALDTAIASVVPDLEKRGTIDATLAVLLTAVLDALRKAVKSWLTDTRPFRVLLLIAATLCFAGGSAMAETKAFPTAGKALGMVKAETAGKWIVLSADFAPVQPIVLDGGKVCVFEGTSGRYAVFLIPPGDTQPEISIVILGGSGPTPPNPPPPPPPPPPPVVPVPTEKLGFITLSRDAASKLPTQERAKAPAVADNFEGTGSKLAAGGFPGADPIAAANAELVTKHRATIGGPGTASRDQYWLPTFFVPWQAKADALGKSGALTKPEDYVQAYKETAEGLRLSAQGVNRVSP